jgi:TIR domain
MKTSPANTQSPHTFDVFLSYSRKDKTIAARLEDELENYRIPRGLRGLVQNLNVFRDEEDITAADDYYRLIEQQIQGSTKLLVVCSPNSRKSKFVADEIQRFIKAHGAKHVIPVLVQGKPNNETADEAEMAFPEPLCENRMPLAADFRGCETHAGSLQKGAYRGAFFSVLAAINDIDRRRLEQIDEKIRARRRAMIFSFAIGIILVLSIALAFAIQAKREAVRREVAEEQKAIAIRERENAEAARQKLQMQYLEAIGAMNINDVLGSGAIPGEVHAADPNAWTTLMKQGELTFTIGREHHAGRVLAVAHDGVLAKSPRLVKQAIEWLRGPRGAKVILLSSGHCEWVPTQYPFEMPARLAEEGYSIRKLPGVIDDLQLKDAGVLIIGNAWGNFTEAEIQAVERFVSAGGGLFATGLGWSWKQDGAKYACQGRSQGQKFDDFSTYPMNRLVAPYEVAWTERY